MFINEEESEDIVNEELKQATFDETLQMDFRTNGGLGNKKGSVVSFSSQLNIQHNGGIHDTVILDELIDKSAIGNMTLGGNPGGLFHDTS